MNVLVGCGHTAVDGGFHFEPAFFLGLPPSLPLAREALALAAEVLAPLQAGQISGM